MPSRLCKSCLNPHKDLFHTCARAWYVSESLFLAQVVPKILILCDPMSFTSFLTGPSAIQTLHLSSSPSSTENIASLMNRTYSCHMSFISLGNFEIGNLSSARVIRFNRWPSTMTSQPRREPIVVPMLQDRVPRSPDESGKRRGAFL